MAQKLIQSQEQKQQQVQRLTAQQMLQVRLLEMPLTELEESVRAELDENPALETHPADEEMGEALESDNNEEPEDYETQNEREERRDALDSALEDIGRDDSMTGNAYDNYHNADYEEIVYGDIVSFYDKLKEQMGMQELTDKQRDIMEYLIGSLDDDGLLRKDIDAFAMNCPYTFTWTSRRMKWRKSYTSCKVLTPRASVPVTCRNVCSCRWSACPRADCER